jgi:uncharacterized protein YdhG (YjbR/CyaY superfamily)
MSGLPTRRLREVSQRTEALPGSASGSVEVDAFLGVLPDEARTALEQLRELIAAAAPEAVEDIAYGVPAFKYRGRPLVSFAAGKGHLAFYVQSPPVMDAHRAELKGYDTSKGTIRFQATEPLPEALVTKLVQARMAETDAATNKSKR